MNRSRRILGLGLLALWMGCADFELAEQSFCERNPERCEEQITATALSFTTPPRQVQVGSCSEVLTVQLEARDGPLQVKADTAVELSAAPSEGLQFFTDADCTGVPVTAVTIPTGSSSASYYFKGTRVGTVTLSATTGNLSDNQTVTLTPIPAVSLAVEVQAPPVTAGACSSAKVQVRGANGATTLVTANTPVSLTVDPNTSVDFYSDAACTTPAQLITLATETGEVPFYFVGRVTGKVTLSASAPGLSPGLQNVEFIPGAGPRLVVLTLPQVATAGTCSSQVVVQSQDAQGNALPTSAVTAIRLAATPSEGFRFYSDASCTTEVTSVNLAQGTTNASFYFRGAKAGNVTVTVTATGYTGNSQAETINPGPPALVGLTAPASVPAGTCSLTSSVELRDSQGNPTATSADRAVNLSSSGTSVTLFSDGACTTAASSVTVPAGATSATFYFRGTQAGTSTLTAISTGLTSGTLNVTIAPSDASVLTFVTPARTVAAGSCSPRVTVQVGTQGNPLPVASAVSVNLSAAPAAGFTFYATATCNTPVTQVTIPAGQSSANFHFRSNQVGTATVTAAAPGLTDAAQVQTTTPGPANTLRFTSPSHTTAAASCSPRVTLQSTDAFGNPSPVAANTSISLNAEFTNTFDGQFQFFSDAGCTVLVPQSQLVLPAGQTTVGFHYRGTRAQLVNLRTFPSGLTGGVQAHTVTAAPAATVRFSPATPPETLLAGTCAVRTVEGRDVYDNPSANAVTLDLSASPSAAFFLDAACTQPTNQVSIVAGSSTASFYFKGLTGGINEIGPLMLRVSPRGLTPVEQQERIIPTVRTGTCFLSGSATSTSCPMSLPVTDLKRAFLTFQATTKAASSSQANLRCFLEDGGGLRCERASANGGDGVNIQWSVAEFPSTTVSVQHHAISCQSNTTYVNLFPEVKRENSFLLLSSRRNDTDQGYDAPRMAELTQSYEVVIQKAGSCSTGDANHLQVVEYPGAIVQRGRIDFMEGSSREILIPTRVDPERSILLYSYYTSGQSSRICERMLRGELISDGRQARFTRGEGDPFGCANTTIDGISWEVIQFPPGTFVQQVTQQLSDFSTSVTLPKAVDMSRTLVIAGGQWASGQLHGEGKYSNGELPSEMRAQAFLSEPSTLKIVRETAFSSATFTLFVIQLAP
jgi:hypothetical protein